MVVEPDSKTFNPCFLLLDFLRTFLITSRSLSYKVSRMDSFAFALIPNGCQDIMDQSDGVLCVFTENKVGLI